MKPSLRRVLADSHIAAIAIAIILLSALARIGSAALRPLMSAVWFIVNAIAIQDIPYISPGLTVVDRTNWAIDIWYAFAAPLLVAAAWALSRWAYGAGPIRTLRRYCPPPWRSHD